MMTSLAIGLIFMGGCASRGLTLAGFGRSPYYEEQVLTEIFAPEITVHLNAPAAARFDPGRPTVLVIYALPNGNTIAQTIGCREQPGLDWHFYIQHIGAQTRRLREIRSDVNLVVAYVEAGGRSWPAWRKRQAGGGERILALVESLRARLPGAGTTVALTAHSGGGSLLFGFIESVEAIPDWVERIVWLDANYGYSGDQRHAEKLVAWLKRSPRHALGAVAYDDREIELNGKKVVSPTGGTYRKTHAMAARLGELMPLRSETLSDRTRWSGLEGRVDLQVFANPENKILHTVLVERNGFIHALSFGTPTAVPADALFASPAYGAWVQAGSDLPG